jgi:hypothetical protein
MKKSTFNYIHDLLFVKFLPPLLVMFHNYLEPFLRQEFQTWLKTSGNERKPQELLPKGFL